MDREARREARKRGAAARIVSVDELVLNDSSNASSPDSSKRSSSHRGIASPRTSLFVPQTPNTSNDDPNVTQTQSRSQSQSIASRIHSTPRSTPRRQTPTSRTRMANMGPRERVIPMFGDTNEETLKVIDDRVASASATETTDTNKKITNEAVTKAEKVAKSSSKSRQQAATATVATSNQSKNIKVPRRQTTTSVRTPKRQHVASTSSTAAVWFSTTPKGQVVSTPKNKRLSSSKRERRSLSSSLKATRSLMGPIATRSITTTTPSREKRALPRTLRERTLRARSHATANTSRATTPRKYIDETNEFPDGSDNDDSYAVEEEDQGQELENGVNGGEKEAGDNENTKGAVMTTSKMKSKQKPKVQQKAVSKSTLTSKSTSKLSSSVKLLAGRIYKRKQKRANKPIPYAIRRSTKHKSVEVTINRLLKDIGSSNTIRPVQMNALDIVSNTIISHLKNYQERHTAPNSTTTVATATETGTIAEGQLNSKRHVSKYCELVSDHMLKLLDLNLLISNLIKDLRSTTQKKAQLRQKIFKTREMNSKYVGHRLELIRYKNLNLKINGITLMELSRDMERLGQVGRKLQLQSGGGGYGDDRLLEEREQMPHGSDHLTINEAKGKLLDLKNTINPAWGILDKLKLLNSQLSELDKKL